MVAESARAIDRAGLRWLIGFEERQGRPLRVLHIGNIANNAYNNAKIQRHHGIDADVTCHDYYHVMACPEWEDADFAGDYGDPSYPDWWNVDLKTFERPQWFAQGSLRTCQSYLLARRVGDRRAGVLWRRLTAQRWLRCRSTRTATALRVVAGIGGRTASRTTRAMTRTLVAFHLLTRVPVQILFRRSRATAKGVRVLLRGEGVRAAFDVFVPAMLRGARHEQYVRDPLAQRFAELFPDRRDQLTRSDYASYAAQTRRWRPLFEHYDIVQAYATDGIIPLLAGVTEWTAYEHGTLREIPFEETSRGRLCALTYREAPVVFVTNSDVLPSIDRLGLDPRRVVFLPHAVDSERLFRFAREQAHLRPPGDARVTFLAPSRQDWVDGDVSWSKANDRLLRAAAVLNERFAFTMVLADWGRDVEATRRLIEELRLEQCVEWVPPLRKTELWSRYLTSHAIIDQFAVPAIGGVTFEAMALGCRVITSVDADITRRFFGRTPPVLAATAVEEIADALEIVLRDPHDAAGRGRAARDWFAEHHSAERIIDLQATAYRRLLEPLPSDA